MPIIPFRPFRDMDKWFDDEWPEEWFRGPRFDRMMPLIRTPKVDIYEKDNDVVVKIELPGVDSKNVNVEVKNNILKIEAKGETHKEEKSKGYYKKEISAGFFKRAIPLPVEVIGEKAEAEYREGILKIVIPKQKSTKKEEKGIKIKVKGTHSA